MELNAKINTIFVQVSHVQTEIVLIYSVTINASVTQDGLDLHVAFKLTTAIKIFAKMVPRVHQYLVE